LNRTTKVRGLKRLCLNGASDGYAALRRNTAPDFARLGASNVKGP